MAIKISREILLVFPILIVVYLSVTMRMHFLVMSALQLLRILLDQILTWWLFDCSSPFLFIVFIYFAASAIFLFSHLVLLEPLLFICLTWFLWISKSWVFLYVLLSILVSLNQEGPVPDFSIDINHFVFILSYFFLLLSLELLYSFQHFLSGSTQLVFIFLQDFPHLRCKFLLAHFPDLLLFLYFFFLSAFCLPLRFTFFYQSYEL